MLRSGNGAFYCAFVIVKLSDQFRDEPIYTRVCPDAHWLRKNLSILPQMHGSHRQSACASNSILTHVARSHKVRQSEIRKECRELLMIKDKSIKNDTPFLIQDAIRNLSLTRKDTLFLLLFAQLGVYYSFVLAYQNKDLCR